MANEEALMAGTKTAGLGSAVFHAAVWNKGFGHFARCGAAKVGDLVPASTVAPELRCRSRACQSAFAAVGA